MREQSPKGRIISGENPNDMVTNGHEPGKCAVPKGEKETTARRGRSKNGGGLILYTQYLFLLGGKFFLGDDAFIPECGQLLQLIDV